MPAKKSTSLSSWAKFGLVAMLAMQACAAPTPVTSTESLQGLVKRLLPPSYHKAFDFQIVPDITAPTVDNKYDVFRVSNKNSTSTSSKILIEGTTHSALGRGLKYYLDQAQVELSWSGNRFDELPLTPPNIPDLELDTGNVVSTGHVRGSFVPWRYYTNVVSFGYQFVFWDWKRWEREIDWMVLNGVNLLPSLVGQEYVFRQFWRNKGLTDSEIGEFISSPVDMPWQRMGNIQGSWNHELRNTSAENDNVYKNIWIDSQWDLQKLIVKRLKELGITPALPAFQAFVPSVVANKYPDNQFRRGIQWQNFPEKYTNVTYVLQTDPLFATLSTEFLELQKSLYNGTISNHYLLDLFNELKPDCITTECLKAVATSVAKALQTFDKDAVWAMQGWFLTDSTIWTPEGMKAFFDGITEAQVSPFVLDLGGEISPIWKVTDGFYGHDFGWSIINNFGTAQGLYGKLPTILTNPFEIFQKYPAGLKGIGVATEGINNNEYIYQTTFDVAWLDPKQTIDGKAHLERYIQRRYGPSKATPKVQDAWNKLRQTVWDAPKAQESQKKSYIEKVPSLKMAFDGWMGTILLYNKTMVAQAWDQLVVSATRDFYSNVSNPYKFDLVDTTREVILLYIFPALHDGLIEAYNAKDLNKVKSYSRQILALIKDADTLLNSHQHFSFGAWVLDAKKSIDPINGNIDKQISFNGSLPTSPNKKGYQHFLESNVRNIFTWWGPKPNGLLNDYASKQWGGLISSYYLPRWQLFLTQIEQAVVTNTEWNADDYNTKRVAFETQWQAQVWGTRNGESWTTNGQEPVNVVREIHERWRTLIFKIAAGGKA
ncbi:hypothetical protein BGZ76_006284 [Entomortierella beljakovae]|nr:hypothetical protein BGZ76_006284 [Entomortierella beljakovae]